MNACFITGAGRGLGARIAERLVEAGTKVALVDIDAANIDALANRISERGGVAMAIPLDVNDRTATEHAVEDAQRLLGPLDGAVTCAGIVQSIPFLDLTEQAWDATMSTNLKGTLFTVQAVGRKMIESGQAGRIVCFASVAGHAGRPLVADYAASKAGVISMVRSSALAFAHAGITVNAICPGVIDTEMTRQVYEEQATTERPAEVALAAVVDSIPLRRIGTPDDIANAALFLLAPASGYITGQSLNVCGGQSIARLPGAAGTPRPRQEMPGSRTGGLPDKGE